MIQTHFIHLKSTIHDSTILNSASIFHSFQTITEKVTRAKDILKNVLDRLILQFEAVRPTFVTAYQSARAGTPAIPPPAYRVDVQAPALPSWCWKKFQPTKTFNIRVGVLMLFALKNAYARYH